MNVAYAVDLLKLNRLSGLLLIISFILILVICLTTLAIKVSTGMQKRLEYAQ